METLQFTKITNLHQLIDILYDSNTTIYQNLNGRYYKMDKVRIVMMNIKGLGDLINQNILYFD